MKYEENNRGHIITKSPLMGTQGWLTDLYYIILCVETSLIILELSLNYIKLNYIL
jgi:hypothetical protein